MMLLEEVEFAVAPMFVVAPSPVFMPRVPPLIVIGPDEEIMFAAPNQTPKPVDSEVPVKLIAPEVEETVDVL
jgi:hypothetical protein